MFRRKKKVDMSSFTNLIAQGSTFQGTVNFSGVLMVKGTVFGDLIAGTVDTSGIVIDETGVVKCNEMAADEIEIHGKVTSTKIRANSSLTICADAVVIGATLAYTSIQVEPGATLHKCVLHQFGCEDEKEESAINQ